MRIDKFITNIMKDARLKGRASPTLVLLLALVRENVRNA